MKTPTYILVGAGGTGSLLFQPLTRYLHAYHTNRGENHILAVIDGDTVEAHNLERQLFDGVHIDVNKAEALILAYGTPGTHFPVPDFVTEDNIATRINDGDIVLIAADNMNVRRRIEAHGLTLDNLIVINGGNEDTYGTCQIWIRADGHNITPPLSFQHPELLAPSEFDPTTLTCAERAELPGGEQTIVANMASALAMLNAIRLVHHYLNHEDDNLPWHEQYFDLNTGNARSADLRSTDGWQEYTQP